jgi:hypothetical protein
MMVANILVKRLHQMQRDRVEIAYNSLRSYCWFD